MAAGSIPVRQFAEVKAEQGPVVFQNVNTSADAFGAAQGRALTALGDGISKIGGAVDRYNARAENDKKSKVMDVYADGKNGLRDYLYNPQGGLYTRKGGQALGASGEFLKFSDNLMNEKMNSLEDQKSKDAFRKMWQNERDTLNEGVMRFEIGQSDEYSKNTQIGVISAAADMASSSYNDPKVINKSVDDIRRAIRINAAGQPIEMVAQAEKTAISSVYQQVILRAAVDDPTKANQLFETYKDKMLPNDISEASKALAPALKKQQTNALFGSVTQSGAAAAGSVDNDAGNRLLSAMQQQESNFDPSAESPVGASGLMQVMPDTARGISFQLGDGEMQGLTDEQVKAKLKDPNSKLGLRYGVVYMQDQLNTFDGDLEAALIAYNAGPGNASKWLKAGRDYSVLPKREETEPYVQKIMNNYIRSSGSKEYGRVDARSEVDQGGLPNSGEKMTRQNWSLGFYTANDILPPTEGGQFVDARAATMMDRLGSSVFQKFGKRLKINEEYDPKGKETAGRRRGTADPRDNPHVQNSRHVHGDAFDVQIQGLSDQEKAEVLMEARKLGFTGVGFYEGGSGHLHLDTGKERSWGPMPAWAREAMQVKVGKGISVAGGVSRRARVQVAENRPAGSVSDRDIAVPINNLTQNAVEAGNIEMASLPQTPEATPIVNAKSYNLDGLEVLLPTVDAEGKEIPDEQVIKTYKETGKHLGKFKTEGEASQYAEALGNPKSDVLKKKIPVVDPNDADLDTWLAQIDASDFPDDVKDAAKSKATVEWNRRDKAKTRAKKEVQEQAWQYVEEGGIDAIPPQLRAKLDHEFMSNAMTYVEKIAKFGAIDTDYSKWYEFNRLSDAQIIDADIMKLRPFLDNEKFDAAIKRQADLMRDREKPDAAIKVKGEGLRTRTQIVDGTVKALSMGDKPQFVGELDEALDRRITYFGVQQKRDPTTLEIQAMVDDIVILNKDKWLTPAKKESTAKLSGMRTREQIVSDTIKAEDKKEDFEYIQNLNIRLDDQIKQFAEAKGKDPDASEIQTMVNRMMIKDKSPWLSEGEDVLSMIGSPDAKDFVGVESTDQIPDKDFEVLVDTYRSFHKTSPSPEMAMSTYNDALKAYMGVDVPIPPDIQLGFKADLEKAKGRKVTDDEIATYYRKYLLKYLGM